MNNNNILLLVEDSPDDEALALRALKKNNILTEVVVARDGAEALDYLFGEGKYLKRDTSVMPAVILLDLKMPKIDGLEVLKCLRADERTELLPVVIFTSSDQDRDIMESYELGCNSYICKPVDFIKFSEAIHQIELYWLLMNMIPPMGSERGKGVNSN